VTGSQLNRQAVRAGLVGAVALIYIALTGMIEKFATSLRWATC
jgi:hypothetical protein